MLIAAQSGRILAHAARRAGYAPLVADLFNDEDTEALAARSVRVPGGLSRTPGSRRWLRALDALGAGMEPIGLAYSGIEDRPDVLEIAAERYGVLGNGAAVVRRVKDPYGLAALCRACAVPHPEIGRAPGDGAWVEKRAGAAGGGHIRPARPGRVRPPRYVQRRVAGEPVSALFLADGRGRSAVLGFTAQWVVPFPTHPYAWGGAVRPAPLDPTLAAAMLAAVERLAAAAGLVGLNGADFLVRADGFDLLEINPRPSASLDVFPDSEGALFRWHVELCRGGALPRMLGPSAPAQALAIAYARRPLTLGAGFAWPEWTADRQRQGIPVGTGEPLCAVRAEAETPEEARALAVERVEVILARAGGA